MKIKPPPIGFIVPAQPVLASRPPSGTDWVHEIKHDGYRMIVRRDGPTVRLYSRNAYDWTGAIGGNRSCCRIDGEAVVRLPGVVRGRNAAIAGAFT